MNRAVELILKGLRRKLFAQIAPSNMAPISYKNNQEECNREIMEALHSDRPFMVARFGSTEMNAIANYIGVRDNPHSVWRYLIGDITEWWWQMTSINQLQSNSGFFPITESNVVRFCELMIKDARQIDILGSWLPLESTISGDLQRAKKFWLGNLEPYYTDSFNKMNWTYALKGKRVLVVHPFTETIKKQYAIKDKLFLNPDFLPEFELLTVKAIQSIGLELVSNPVRGGTDGAQLSFKGLPCPNLGTGGYGFHGPFEHISVEGMENAIKIIKEIVKNPIDV